MRDAKITEIYFRLTLMGRYQHRPIFAYIFMLAFLIQISKY